MTVPAIDPLALTQALIRCPSVTPVDAGAIDVLATALAPVGFACHRLRFGEGTPAPIENLYARYGAGRPHLCFAGHTDVVPPGDPARWRSDPFAGTIVDDDLVGRGAVDMKGAIAAFATAAARFIARRGPDFGGSISLLITGDEEGLSIDGTVKVVDWLEARGEAIDAGIVGEPTSEKTLADAIKIGRRGSLNARLTVKGEAGHVAYPHLADNPVHRLVRMLMSLVGTELDQGSEHFQPSSLQLTTIDVGNPTTNVIPAEARAAFNIRFNDHHSSASLERWMRTTLDAVGGRYELEIQVSGESFFTPPGPLVDTVVAAVAQATGQPPRLSTGGGISDARFLKRLCPVVELGLVGETMHKIDERVTIADLARLAGIYEAILDRFFARA